MELESEIPQTPQPLYYCLHLIDTVGRHYVFNIDQEPITMLVNQDQFVWTGKDNNLQDKFVDLYRKLMVERNSVCVLTPNNMIMIHSDQITGIQLRYEPGY